MVAQSKKFYNHYAGAMRLASICPALRGLMSSYTSVWPSQSINYLTPLDYYRQLTLKAQKPHR